MSQVTSSDFTPTIEYTRSVCTCGKELSNIFYQLTAKAHFERFALQTELIQDDLDNMGFSDHTRLHQNNFCCLMNLRYGIREPITIVPPIDQDARKYPEGLPGPLSREKTLSWY